MHEARERVTYTFAQKATSAALGEIHALKLQLQWASAVEFQASIDVESCFILKSSTWYSRKHHRLYAALKGGTSQSR